MNTIARLDAARPGAGRLYPPAGRARRLIDVLPPVGMLQFFTRVYGSVAVWRVRTMWR